MAFPGPEVSDLSLCFPWDTEEELKPSFFHSIIRSASVVEYLSCAWHPDRYWEPMSDVDFQRADV